MDIETLLKIATTYLADYFREFTETLSKPRCTAALSGVSDEQAVNGAPGYSTSNAETNINSDVWVFVVFSVFIGSTLALTSGIQSKDDLQVIMIYVITNWVAFSFYAFLLTRFILRGSASFSATLKVTLFVLSVTYVLCNFAALLGSFVPPVDA